MQSVTSGNSTVSYNYLTNGSLNRLTAPSGTVYNFAYDTFGRTSSIAIGNRILSSTEYLNNHSSLVNKFTYGNGVYKNYTYDNLDRVLTESINGNQILSYLYDKRGNLVRVNDLQANVVTDFVFDLIGRPQGIKMSDGQRLHISYDNLNRVSLSKWSLNGISQLTEYIYGSNTVSGQKNGLIYGVKNNGVQRLSYSYDELCRLASRTLNTTTPYITEYGYLEGSAPNTTTALVKTLKNGNDIYEYSYDDVGNITQVKLNNVVIESYTYDSLGQLTSATYNGDTYTYLYDNGGNITKVKKNGTVIKAYTYGDSEWKDLLTKFNNTDITYDTIGNPLSYRDGYSFTWANGRQLAAISQNNNALASYTYNADGLRTSKTVNGVTTNYYWINGILQGQKTGDEYIIFLYDENGTAYGMLVKNGTTESTYYYVRNLQGDIIGILDSAGVQVVSYTYGAWGDVLSVGGSLASTIGQQNPLRYRGYYYDGETGLYYVNTRYYDPITYRFINSDTTSLITATPIALSDKNLFAYCDNNPVMRIDIDGEFWDTIWDLFSLGISVVEVVINPSDPTAWTGLAGDTVDLIPFVTGVGETVRVVNTGKKMMNVAEGAETIVTIKRATEFTYESNEIVRKLEKKGLFTKSNRLDGIQIHKGYRAYDNIYDIQKEYRRIPGIRPDYIDFSKNIIYELKPFNVRSIISGLNQLTKYNNALGGGFDMFLELY